jgi:hypothetical protein
MYWGSSAFDLSSILCVKVSQMCDKAGVADRFPSAFKRFRRLDASGG